MIVADPPDSIVDSNPCRSRNFFYTSGTMIAFALGIRDGKPMELKITTRVVSPNVVLDLSGRLCLLDRSLLERINSLLAEGLRDFTLDLADVSYIDSFGLGQLVTVWTSIQNRSGRVKLLRPNERVRKLLHITKLDTVFEVHAK
jgi:anti-sigma B factor antagonist